MSPEAGPLIAVVDDEEYIVDLLTFQLEDRGVRVLPFTSGQLAIEALAHTRVDAVLTDIRMPGVSGRDVCRFVRATHPGTALIVMTGFADVDAELEGLDIQHRLQKPFKAGEVEAILARALGRALP